MTPIAPANASTKKLEDVSRTALDLLRQPVVDVAAVDRVVHIMAWYMLLNRSSLSVFADSYGVDVATVMAFWVFFLLFALGVLIGGKELQKALRDKPGGADTVFANHYQCHHDNPNMESNNGSPKVS